MFNVLLTTLIRRGLIVVRIYRWLILNSQVWFTLGTMHLQVNGSYYKLKCMHLVIFLYGLCFLIKKLYECEMA